MNISFFAPIYVAINKKAGDQAYRFFELLCNMRFSENRNDPLRKFTNLMVGNASSLKKYKIGTKRALLIKTWNAFYEGKSISALKFADDNEFPSILPK